MFEKTKTALVIAAHPDDEIVGLGGTLLKLKKKKININLVFISDGVQSKIDNEISEKIKKKKSIARERKAISVSKLLKAKSISFLRHENLNLHNSNKLKIVKELIKIINDTKPDVVFIHSNKDLNPDHRISNECSITALRPTLKKNPQNVFAFEIPSSTDWALHQFGMFKPNLFVNIENEFREKNKLLDIYKKQLWKYPHPLSKKFLDFHSRVAGSVSKMNFCERFEIIKICA